MPSRERNIRKREFLQNLFYEFALSLDSTLSDAWNNKGLILANLGRLAPALQCFDEVLKISPRHAYTLSNKGMVLAQQKRYQDALDCFEAALVVDPYFAGARVQ